MTQLNGSRDLTTVSVVIPTLRRPALLELAVRSVLAQELDDGSRLEVVIAVSDPRESADMTAARALAADPRVKVALGPGTTAGGTRNAGVRIATGELLAFMDDDCEAEPGWLRAMLRAADHADLVQGKTVPQRRPPLLWRTISVTPPSWLWETCNLAVRREWFDKCGGFNEGWNPTGRVEIPFGEDAEWGWMLVRNGARYAAAPEAVVRHVVEPRDVWGYLAYHSRIRFFPMLFRTTPEVRRIFYRGYFVNRRHAQLVAALALAGAALASRAGRYAPAAVALGGGTAILYLLPLVTELGVPPLHRSVKVAALRSANEMIELGACIYGSVRWRRLLL